MPLVSTGCHSRPGPHALLHLLTLVVAFGFFLTLGQPTAVAHDSLVSSTPADGATLSNAPSRVVFVFSGRIQSDFAQVAVVDSAGENVIAGEPVVDGTDVRFPLPALADGQYQASFRVVSSDGHPINGSISFSVAARDTTSDADDATAEAASETIERQRKQPAPSEPTTPDSASTPVDEPGQAAPSTAEDEGPVTLGNVLILLGLAAAAGASIFAGVRLQQKERENR